MKATPTWVIFAGEKAWRVARCGGASCEVRDLETPPDAPPDAFAQAAAAALALMGATGRAVSLAAPSHWCLCATVNTANLPRARRQAMVFRLEEKLPLPAEEFVADFIDGPAGDSLGVAGQVRLLQPAVLAIEKAGWTIDTICPAALLAAQRYVESEKLPPTGALLFTHDGQLELLQFDDGRVKAWDTLAADPDDAAMELGVRALHRAAPLRVACADLPADIMARLQSIDGLELIDAALPPALQAAAMTAHAIAHQGKTPWIELRRDALGAADAFRGARRSIRAAVLAAIGLAVCLAAAVVWRASAYQGAAGDYAREQQAIFERVLPGKPMNDGFSVAAQLLREERRLRGLSGEGQDLPSRPSALLLLQRLLNALPADGRCRVNELRLNEDKVWVEAVVPSHAEATSVATSLAADRAFRVDPPRTEQVGGGSPAVSMTLTATAAAPLKGGRP